MLLSDIEPLGGYLTSEGLKRDLERCPIQCSYPATEDFHSHLQAVKRYHKLTQSLDVDSTLSIQDLLDKNPRLGFFDDAIERFCENDEGAKKLGVERVIEDLEAVSNIVLQSKKPIDRTKFAFFNIPNSLDIYHRFLEFMGRL